MRKMADGLTPEESAEHDRFNAPATQEERNRAWEIVNKMFTDNNLSVPLEHSGLKKAVDLVAWTIRWNEVFGGGLDKKATIVDPYGIEDRRSGNNLKPKPELTDEEYNADLERQYLENGGAEMAGDADDYDDYETGEGII